MVIFLKNSSLETSQPRNRLSNLSMINVVEKYQTKGSKQQEKIINILSYYPHQIEKINCLGETELASGKTLKSCKAVLRLSVEQGGTKVR